MTAKQILVIEEDRAMSWLLHKQLEKLNHRADIVSNGSDAVVKLTQGSASYRVIIMDITVPEAPALEAIRLIRNVEKSHKLPRVPIVAVSESTEKAACLKAGVDDYYELPLSLDDMRAIVDKWVVGLDITSQV
jgi:CheY-like chemotaxis protein